MSKNNDNFQHALAAANNGKRYPVLSLIKDDPILAATVSKLVMSQHPIQYNNTGDRETLPPSVHMFKNTSEHLAQNISDARTVLQVLPDVELAAQILVSSIIAPKDMVTTEITYSVTEGLISPDVSASLIARTKTYFEQDYKIKPLLAKMLRDILFETGSYGVAVIPENSIDEVINGQKNVTMESLSDHLAIDGSVKPLGLLGNVKAPMDKQPRRAPGLSMESINAFTPNLKVDGRVTLESEFNREIDTFLSVTDNHNLLKIPVLNQKIREQRIGRMLGSKALESITPKFTDRQLTGKVYKERNANFVPIAKLKTQEQLNRKTVGNPMIVHLPSESIIPVYVPGCVSEHVGFFILIDENGNPVSKAENADYYQQLSSRLNSNGSFPSAMLTRVKSQMSGFQPDNKEHMDYTARVYGDMVEQDLSSRLQNGVYGNGVTLAKNVEVYRIMLARTLAKQHSQLLFIPIELMTYMAFSHTSDGMGKSLLDDMKIINSLRAMVLFANVMSSLKNSIGRTEVKLKLDENDPNPQKTIELTMHEIIRTRQQYFPLGMNSPTDLTDWLQKSGFEFTFEGHPGLPDVSVDFGEKATNYVKPDTDLEDRLRKQSIMACGLSPETVDSTFNTEFAVSVVTNNILLSKRVIQTQEQFTPQLSAHLRKVMLNSEELINDLRKILTDNFDKLKVEVTEGGQEILTNIKAKKATKEVEVSSESEKKAMINTFLHEYIMNFEVTLPMPNSVTLENQMTGLDTYSKALDVSIEAWVSEKFFTTDLGGDVANQVAVIKEVLKAHFLRKYMANEGIMTELADLTTLSHNGLPAIDIYKTQEDHITNLTKSLTKFLTGLQPIKEKSNEIMQAMGGAGEDQSQSQPEENAGGEEPDDGGMPPDDMPGGEEPEEAPEETPEEPEKKEEPKEDKSNLNGEEEEPEEEKKEPEKKETEEKK